MSNLTSSTEDKSFCTLPYERCLCSLLSDKTENSENCITDIELQCSCIRGADLPCTKISHL
jgi:hypothetical protein